MNKKNKSKQIKLYRRMKMGKINAKVNEIDMRTIKKISKAKNWIFGKIKKLTNFQCDFGKVNKIYRPLARLIVGIC
jgi:hypothetical protein